jgi:hypothetical protein
MLEPAARALGAAVWGRRVARLPAHGVLLVATDLQGNLRDWNALLDAYRREQAAGHEVTLGLLGDLVHGPSPDLNEPGAWPDYLGTPYRDESAELVRDFERRSRSERIFSLLGNHEHAHIGGPVVPKFYPDEAAVLDAALGADRARIHALFRELPLLAVTPCGVVLSHAAPRQSAPDLEAFERLYYGGYERVPIHAMAARDPLGALLWARSATSAQARTLLAVAGFASGSGVCVFGHEVVHEGFAAIGREQLCLSTSYGLEDARKLYLRLDLGAHYRSVEDLRPGHELLPLHGG